MDRPVEILAKRVAQRIAELGKNDYAVSMEAVGKADLVRDINRGKMPGAQRLAALSRALDTTTDWLLGMTDIAPHATVAAPPRDFTPEPGTPVFGQSLDPQPVIQQSPLDLPKNVPVLGNGIGSGSAFADGTPVELQLIQMGEVVDMVRRPPGIANVRAAYALYVRGDSQAPRYEEGELIYVNPSRPAVPGDDVVVQLIDEDDCANCALVKRLVRRTATDLILRQFNPPLEFTVPLRRVKDNGRAVHKILNFAELYGY